MMTCKTCRLPAKDLQIVNLALLGGVSLRHIAARFPIGTSSLKRHRDQHIPATLAKAHDAEEVLKADKLLAETMQDRKKVREMFFLAASSEPVAAEEPVMIKALKADRSFAVQASREARGYTELLLKASGEWKERIGVDLAGELTHKAELEEATSIKFLKERYPKLLPELAAWGAEQMKNEKGNDRNI